MDCALHCSPPARAPRDRRRHPRPRLLHLSRPSCAKTLRPSHGPPQPARMAAHRRRSCRPQRNRDRTGWPSGAATHRSGADHRPDLPRHRPHSAAGLQRKCRPPPTPKTVVPKTANGSQAIDGQTSFKSKLRNLGLNRISGHFTSFQSSPCENLNFSHRSIFCVSVLYIPYHEFTPLVRVGYGGAATARVHIPEVSTSLAL